MFRIIPRPSSVASAKIYNVNVRGKRGNTVQAFPALEYGFSPEYLEVAQNDYVHCTFSLICDDFENFDSEIAGNLAF